MDIFDSSILNPNWDVTFLMNVGLHLLDIWSVFELPQHSFSEKFGKITETQQCIKTLFLLKPD
jgi:hypothetical protein